MRYLFVLLILFIHSSNLQAQSKITYNSNVNFGAQLLINYGKGQKFPGIKVFAAFSIIAKTKSNILFHYGPSLSIYTKTIGANLNPLVGDVQVDFTNSFSVGYSSKDSLASYKYFRTIHTGDYYNVVTKLNHLILLTSNVILNNHKRNQIVGAITVSSGRFTLNYYNDGPPFNIIPLADNFDRYWTGGGGLFFHRKEGYNTAEFSFDQFTGYTPLLYELSNILGIDVPIYSKNDNAKNKYSPTSYNTSTYQLKIRPNQYFSIDAGVIGDLKIKVKGIYRYFGIQEMIHSAGGMSLHPNNDMTRLFFGTTYLNNIHAKK